MNEAHEQLLFEVEGDAFYRRQKAEEYPEDGRNQPAAEAAERIAAFVHDVPDTDLRLIRLTYLRQVAGLTESGVPTPERARASRVGFQGGPPSDPDLWLSVYVQETADALAETLASEADIARDVTPVGTQWMQPPRAYVEEAEGLLGDLAEDWRVIYVANLLRRGEEEE